MSIWSSIAEKVKEIIKKMIGAKTIEQNLNIAPLISSAMEQAIQEWSDMYKNQAPWLHEPNYSDPTRVVSLGLPSMIASEKARMVLLEFKSEITTPTKDVERDNPNYKEPEPDEFGNILPTTEPKTIVEKKPVSDTTRADYLNSQYEKLKEKLRVQLEYTIAKGGIVVKPYVVMNTFNVDGNKESERPKIEFDFIQADNFYPMAFDSTGTITEAAFVQTIQNKSVTYHRLEYHKFDNGTVTIENRAYKSTNIQKESSGVDLGQEIPLSEVPQWKELQRTTTIKNVTRPLFVYFKMPEANTIDMSSPLGVSGYSRAKSLIKDADMQYSRMLWEYEAGEMAIDIDRDALSFKENADGHGNGVSVLSSLQRRLYRTVDLGESNTFITHAPNLRDASYIQGLNTILMRIEDACFLSRGSISDATAEARTATEIKILKQKVFTANAEIQHALELALKDVIYVANVYCDLYKITPDGEYDTSFEWDDSILVDIDSELNTRLSLMQQGLAGKVETRMWYFGETEEQAREAIQKIDEENAKAAEADLIMQSNMNREE